MRMRSKNVGQRGRPPKSKRGRGHSSSNNDLRPPPIVPVQEPPSVKLTTSNCVLCDSILSISGPYDPTMEKYFESFCTFLNITMSEEFSWDFKQENFPFCTSCTLVLKSLTNLYEMLEKTHYEIAGFVDQVKSIVIRSNSINNNDTSKTKKSKADNFSTKRVAFLRGQISLDIDESAPHVPLDRGQQRGNVEIKVEPPFTETSNNVQKQITPSITTTTISSERGSIDEELDSDMRAPSPPIVTDDATAEETGGNSSQEEIPESLFDQYVREQLSLMKFIEEKENEQHLEDEAAADSDHNEYEAAAADSDHNEDDDQHEDEYPPEEPEEDDFDEAGSPPEDSKYLPGDSPINETTDNPRECPETNMDVTPQESVQQMEATVVGGRCLRPRNNNKRKYVELDEVMEMDENEKDEDFNAEVISEDDESSNHDDDDDDDEFEVENPTPRKRNKPDNRKQTSRNKATVKKSSEHRVKYSCGLCCRQFPNRDEAAQHYKEPHFTDNKFNCGLCQQEFTNREEILAHQKDHQKDQQMKHFTERYYIYLEDARGNFIRENTNVISKSDFVSKISCAVCTDDDKAKLKDMSCSEFSMHSKSHQTSDKPVQCLDCDTRSSTYSAAYIHYLTYHEENMPFHCLHCKEVFPVMSILSYHFGESHRTGDAGSRPGTVQGVDFLYDC